MAERCLSCKSKKVVIYDELIGENGEVNEDCNRFDLVAKLEAMTPDERFAFWQNELSKCIRCNACRNVCPACTCENVCLTTTIRVLRKRQRLTVLRKICSILSAHSMLPADAQTAANAHACAHSIFHFTCSTANSSRMQTSFTVNIRQARIWKQSRLLLTLHMTIASQALFMKEEVPNNV